MRCQGDLEMTKFKIDLNTLSKREKVEEMKNIL